MRALKIGEHRVLVLLLHVGVNFSEKELEIIKLQLFLPFILLPLHFRESIPKAKIAARAQPLDSSKAAQSSKPIYLPFIKIGRRLLPLQSEQVLRRQIAEAQPAIRPLRVNPVQFKHAVGAHAGQVRPSVEVAHAPDVPLVLEDCVVVGFEGGGVGRRRLVGR